MQYPLYKNVSKRIKLRVKKKHKRDLREAKRWGKEFYNLMIKQQYLLYYSRNGKVVFVNAR